MRGPELLRLPPVRDRNPPRAQSANARSVGICNVSKNTTAIVVRSRTLESRKLIGCQRDIEMPDSVSQDDFLGRLRRAEAFRYPPPFTTRIRGVGRIWNDAERQYQDCQ